MTATDHLRAARENRNRAQAEIFAAHLAAERGDSIAASRHHEAHEFELRVAHHHEVQATHARLAALDTGAATEIPGLTDGPVLVAPTATGGDWRDDPFHSDSVNCRP